MALCENCGHRDFGTFTHDGIVHRDPACAWAATNAVPADDVRACGRCGQPGLHGGTCERCAWWAS